MEEEPSDAGALRLTGNETFAVFTPSNTRAKLAMSEAFFNSAAQPDQARIDKFWSMSDGTTEDHEAAKLVWPGCESTLAKRLKTGQYICKLNQPLKEYCWRFGEVRPNKVTQFLVDGLGGKGDHAKVELSMTDRLSVIKPGSKGEHDIRVDGILVPRECRLTSGSIVTIGGMEFFFQYQPIHNTPEWIDYLRSHPPAEAPLTVVADTQRATPWSKSVQMKLGDYSIGQMVADHGSSTISVATNPSGKTFAVKQLMRNHANIVAIDRRINTLKDITAQAKQANGAGVVTLVDSAVHLVDPNSSSVVGFVHLVLGVFVEQDFSLVLPNGMVPMPIAKRLIHGMLGGVAFLHSIEYIHGSLKPSKVGLIGDRVVLLGIDKAVKYKPGDTGPDEKGSGPPAYTAPEKELCSYDKSVDLWPIDVIGYQLLFGRHPFETGINPFHPLPDDATRTLLGEMWTPAYKAALNNLLSLEDNIGKLLVSFLAYPWSINFGARPTAADALQNSSLDDMAKSLSAIAPRHKWVNHNEGRLVQYSSSDESNTDSEPILPQVHALSEGGSQTRSPASSLASHDLEMTDLEDEWIDMRSDEELVEEVDEEHDEDDDNETEVGSGEGTVDDTMLTYIDQDYFTAQDFFNDNNVVGATKGEPDNEDDVTVKLGNGASQH